MLTEGVKKQEDNPELYEKLREKMKDVITFEKTLAKVGRVV